MSVDFLKRKIAPYYRNVRGWRTRRKIVVIESDDWGSIRMPSPAVYKQCLKAGYRVDRNVYERYDSLASEEDLELLFDLLGSVKDFRGKHPVITANALTANPDFDKIRESGFLEYHYERIDKTFEKYPRHSRCLELWREGVEKEVFYPQSHGREHVNISLFMKALQAGNRDVHFGFDLGMPGSIGKGLESIGNGYVEALRYLDEGDKYKKLDIVLDGLKLFEEQFGYRSATFIPPNYFWSPDFDSVIKEAGINFYQGNFVMKEPKYDGTIERHYHKLGEENIHGQKYLVRNVFFEPSLFRQKVKQPVEQCLYDIAAAFRMKKPAIICSHRLNYVGFIDNKNRDRNLKMLKELLFTIQKKWSEVEFMNSVQLGKVMEDK